MLWKHPRVIKKKKKKNEGKKRGFHMVRVLLRFNVY